MLILDFFRSDCSVFCRFTIRKYRAEAVIVRLLGLLLDRRICNQATSGLFHINDDWKGNIPFYEYNSMVFFTRLG